MMKIYPSLHKSLQKEKRLRASRELVASNRSLDLFRYTWFRSRGFTARLIANGLRGFCEVICLGFVSDIKIGTLSAAAFLLQIILGAQLESCAVTLRQAMIEGGEKPHRYWEIVYYASTAAAYGLLVCLGVRHLGMHPIVFLILGARGAQSLISGMFFFRTYAISFRQRIFIRPGIVWSITASSIVLYTAFTYAPGKYATPLILLVGFASRIWQEIYFYLQALGQVRKPLKPVVATRPSLLKGDCMRMAANMSQMLPQLVLLASSQSHDTALITTLFLATSLTRKICDRFALALQVDIFNAFERGQSLQVERLFMGALKRSVAVQTIVAIGSGLLAANSGLGLAPLVWFLGAGLSRAVATSLGMVGADRRTWTLTLVARLALAGSIPLIISRADIATALIVAGITELTVALAGLVSMRGDRLNAFLSQRNSALVVARQNATGAYSTAIFCESVRNHTNLHLNNSEPPQNFLVVNFNRSFDTDRIEAVLACCRILVLGRALCVATKPNQIAIYSHQFRPTDLKLIERDIVLKFALMIANLKWHSAAEFTAGFENRAHLPNVLSPRVDYSSPITLATSLQLWLREASPTQNSARWYTREIHGNWCAVDGGTNLTRQTVFIKAALRSADSPYLKQNRFETVDEYPDSLIVLRPWGIPVAILSAPKADATLREHYEQVHVHLLKAFFAKKSLGYLTRSFENSKTTEIANQASTSAESDVANHAVETAKAA